MMGLYAHGASEASPQQRKAFLHLAGHLVWAARKEGEQRAESVDREAAGERQAGKNPA